MSTYTVSTSPGRVETAGTIPEALTCLGRQLLDELPAGSVQWCVTDPIGTEHRGRNCLNGRFDLLVEAIEELLSELYSQLHRAADGGVPRDWRGRPSAVTRDRR